MRHRQSWEKDENRGVKGANRMNSVQVISKKYKKKIRQLAHGTPSTTTTVEIN